MTSKSPGAAAAAAVDGAVVAAVDTGVELLPCVCGRRTATTTPPLRWTSSVAHFSNPQGIPMTIHPQLQASACRCGMWMLLLP